MILDTGQSDPPSADEEVAKLRFKYRETPLSRLIEDEILILDRDENLVKRGPQFEAVHFDEG